MGIQYTAPNREDLTRKGDEYAVPNHAVLGKTRWALSKELSHRPRGMEASWYLPKGKPSRFNNPFDKLGTIIRRDGKVEVVIPKK